MKSKSLLPILASGMLLIVTLVFGAGRPAMPVQADALLQDVPRLDGKNVYFTEASKEASRFDRSDSGISRFAGLLRYLGANLYTLEWRTGFPSDADLIVIAGPIDDLAPDQIARLWSYVNNNGRVLLLADPVVTPVRALPAGSGLFQLMWADMGLRARQDVAVVQAQAADGSAATLQTNFVTSDVRQSPITQNVSGDLAFFGARSLEVDASIQGYVVTPLLYTPDGFFGEVDYDDYLENGAIQFNIGRDTTAGRLPLAAAYENSTTGSRLVLIGDRQFATNGAGFQTAPPNSASFVYPANVSFLLNASTWLLGAEPVELSFPTPGATATATITPSPTPQPTTAADSEPTATPAS